MKDLLKLLERISASLNKDTNTKETIARVISERVGASFKPEQLALKEGVLELTAGAAFKNEIRLKEEAILAELKEVHKLPVARIIYK
jgi:hypothetical protein